MQVYDPSAIVLQCGADSLTNDRLGCFNLTLKGAMPFDSTRLCPLRIPRRSSFFFFRFFFFFFFLLLHFILHFLLFSSSSSSSFSAAASAFSLV